MFRDQCLDLLIDIGLFVPDVTPMAPHGVQVENDEAMISGRLRENSVTPMALPGNGRGIDLCRKHQGGADSNGRVHSCKTHS